MKNVKFEPWEGKNYKKGGFFGKKILVIGESFYCSEEEAVSTLTDKVINDYLAIRKGEYRENNGRWTNTYLKFERSLVGKETTPEDSRTIWDSIAFHNFLQVPMSGARESGTHEDYMEGQKAFLEVIDEYQPDLIIVWGVGKLYEYLPGEKDGWICGDKLKIDEYDVNNGYYLRNGKKSRVIAVYHPSTSKGYQWDWWHRVIKVFL